MTYAEQIVKSAMNGDVVEFRETVQLALAEKMQDALAIQKIQVGLNLLQK